MGDDDNACVRNIVKEIIRECFPKQIQVHKNFVTYLTKLLLMDPNWGISEDFFVRRENVQKFVGYVLEEMLEKQDRPLVCTLKIQFYFDCNLKHVDYVIETNRNDIRNRLARLKDDIFCSQNVSDKEELDKLFRKIVYYITLISGLGNPTQTRVFQEVSSALKSALDDDELKAFMRSSKISKHELMEQLIKVVAGIRLFNKDCGKGGEGIENLPELLNKAIDVIKEGLQMTLLNVMEKVNTLTTIIDRCYVSKKTYDQFEMLFEIPKNIVDFVAGFDIEYTKDLLVFFRQYELIVRGILEQLDILAHKADSIFKAMEKVLKHIHETVFMRVAVTIQVVFPLFEQLSNIWFQLQDQVLLLSRINQIISNLELYAKQPNYSTSMIHEILGANGALTDAQRLEKTAHLKIRSENPDIEILSVEDFRNFDKIDLEYLGFCCWKLIETDGALIPGNPSMGIARYKGKNFVFSCEEGCSMFSKNPDIFVNRVLDLARRKPQLVNFLQLQDALEKVYGVEKLVQETTKTKLCEDKIVQTLDQVENQIDAEYTWNIWELKREALNLAALLKCKTTSSQTDKVSSTNSIKTQTYSYKDVSQQCSRDNYTNVPARRNFIYGLRGRKSARQFLIELTTPITE
ncbi:cilia- and flagella-associated protein 206-like [Cylas formicarius]|uniref:cilia- and flagella-associated protein 206-like n=1 Tax=Cylas formicarius TaxID=197179 RepID=UPI002958858A|nr:cilia- and flagella-associated protein 206-like [Cylas formicarius]